MTKSSLINTGQSGSDLQQGGPAAHSPKGAAHTSPGPNDPRVPPWVTSPPKKHSPSPREARGERAGERGAFFPRPSKPPSERGFPLPTLPFVRYYYVQKNRAFLNITVNSMQSPRQFVEDYLKKEVRFLQVCAQSLQN